MFFKGNLPKLRCMLQEKAVLRVLHNARDRMIMSFQD